MEEEIQRKIIELENLRNLMIDLTTELSLDVLLEKIVHTAKEITGARYAALGVVDKSGKGIERFITIGLTNQELSIIKGCHSPKGKGLLDSLFKEKTPLQLEDLTKDKRFVGFPRGHPAMRSFLGVPIISKGKIFGGIYLTEKQGGFTQEDKNLVHTLTAGASAAIENARLYNDLQKAYTELLEVDKLKSDIIANVSHELRTPITIANGALDVLKGEEDKETRDQFINMTIEALKRLNSIIGDLIAAATTDEIKKVQQLTPVNLTEIIDLVTNNFKPLIIKKKIKMKIQVEEDLPRVKGNFKQILHVMGNLLDNAIKFNREGGSITIKATKNKGKVQVCVIDTGKGIPRKQHKKIFKPLYQEDSTTTRKYSGTGMGLTIVKDVVEAYGEKVIVESKVGKGSRFCFNLPLA